MHYYMNALSLKLHILIKSLKKCRFKYHYIVKICTSIYQINLNSQKKN